MDSNSNNTFYDYEIEKLSEDVYKLQNEVALLTQRVSTLASNISLVGSILYEDAEVKEIVERVLGSVEGKLVEYVNEINSSNIK